MVQPPENNVDDGDYLCELTLSTVQNMAVNVVCNSSRTAAIAAGWTACSVRGCKGLAQPAWEGFESHLCTTCNPLMQLAKDGEDIRDDLARSGVSDLFSSAMEGKQAHAWVLDEVRIKAGLSTDWNSLSTGSESKLMELGACIHKQWEECMFINVGKARSYAKGGKRVDNLFTVLDSEVQCEEVTGIVHTRNGWGHTSRSNCYRSSRPCSSPDEQGKHAYRPRSSATRNRWGRGIVHDEHDQKDQGAALGECVFDFERPDMRTVDNPRHSLLRPGWPPRRACKADSTTENAACLDVKPVLCDDENTKDMCVTLVVGARTQPGINENNKCSHDACGCPLNDEDWANGNIVCWNCDSVNQDECMHCAGGCSFMPSRETAELSHAADTEMENTIPTRVNRSWGNRKKLMLRVWLLMLTLSMATVGMVSAYSGIDAISDSLMTQGSLDEIKVSVLGWAENDEWAAHVLHKRNPDAQWTSDAHELVTNPFNTSNGVSADILHAGFPCQPVAPSGDKLGAKHDQGDGFIVCFEAAEAHKTILVILENVVQFKEDDEQHGLYSAMMLKAKMCGYTMLKEQRLSHSQCGGCTARQRLFWIFVRTDIQDGTLSTLREAIEFRQVTNNSVEEHLLHPKDMGEADVYVEKLVPVPQLDDEKPQLPQQENSTTDPAWRPPHAFKMEWGVND